MPDSVVAVPGLWDRALPRENGSALLWYNSDVKAYTYLLPLAIALGVMFAAEPSMTATKAPARST